MILINYQKAPLLAFILIQYISVYSQSLSPSVLANASGTGKTNRVWLDWTLGETAVHSVYSNSRMYTEGFHQPTLIIREGVIRQDNVTIHISPNPTLASINIDILTNIDSDVMIDMMDIKGSHLMRTNLKSGIHQAHLDVHSFTAGIYFLQIRNVNGSLVKTFKVIKL